MSKEVVIHVIDTMRYNYKTIPPKNALIKNLSGHSHNAYEFIYFLGGDATYVVENKRYKLRPGDLIITRPSTYHFIQVDTNVAYERHNVLFDHKRLGVNMHMLPEGIDVLNIADGAIISEIFEKMIFYAKKFSAEEFVDIAKLLIQEIVYNLSLTEEESKNNFSVINPILSRALEYISRNLFTIKDMSEVAQAVFVSDSYLYRLFGRELFNTPKKYITEKRLLWAQKQLQKGRNPAKIAEECGFEDYTTFYRNYVKLFGKNPSKEA